jgi:hypothetical protein
MVREPKAGMQGISKETRELNKRHGRLADQDDTEGAQTVFVIVRRPVHLLKHLMIDWH